MRSEDDDLQTYLARIRKTVEASKRVVSEAALRIAETDRMLERQGLTREQVMNFHFTEAQREAVNAELARRGMDPVDWDDIDSGAQEDPWRETERWGDAEQAATDSELEQRQKKFGMMMKPFQI